MAKKGSRLARREAIEGFLFISPWIVGFVVFLAFPIAYSLYLGFTSYDYVNAPVPVGLANYQRALLDDPIFWSSMKVTLKYVAMRMPLQLAISFGVALMLNMRIRGMNVLRTIYYLPSVLPLIAVSLLWIWIFNPIYGILNQAIGLLAIKGPAWLYDPEWALFALVIMSLWGIGRTVIIYLAGLQNVNPELYDAAYVDGAGAWGSFMYVTIPMMTPVIFFNLVMGIIGSLQAFTQSFVMTAGGPAHSTLFVMLYLYNNAFRFFKPGYASALAWILFLVILFFTMLVVRSSSAWVYYEDEVNRG